ncbi:unnamed protein product [Sphenostylis stenocarpa]|uniref:Uncharacterized protein n=1 Tax=Sphenostylis stenocarpa TaxID=92480 RepID=A0AA86S7F6_9FABA|nr:unnamed protein product [Sphenostylis stenocarpa]
MLDALLPQKKVHRRDGVWLKRSLEVIPWVWGMASRSYRRIASYLNPNSPFRDIRTYAIYCVSFRPCPQTNNKARKPATPSRPQRSDVSAEGILITGNNALTILVLHVITPSLSSPFSQCHHDVYEESKAKVGNKAYDNVMCHDPVPSREIPTFKKSKECLCDLTNLDLLAEEQNTTRGSKSGRKSGNEDPSADSLPAIMPLYFSLPVWRGTETFTAEKKQKD